MAIKTRLCSVEGCEKKHYCKSYCQMHYIRVRSYGEPGEAAPRASRWTGPGNAVCGVDGCEGPRSARGLCNTHYYRAKRNGDINVRKKKANGERDRYTAQGYVYVRAPEGHPNANKNGFIREHALVMSRVLGRPLLPGENVHHKNGVRDDNRPENLELWVRPQPTGIRAADAVAWAKEILATYEKLVEEHPTI